MPSESWLDELTGLFLGTPMYAPPERADPSLDHGRARDVWAFGCVLLEVLVLIAFGWRTEQVPHTCDASTKHVYHDADGITSWVEVFKEDRRLSGANPETRTFADKPECVEKWLGLVLSLSADHMCSKLAYVTHSMLIPDPAKRWTSENCLGFVQAKNWKEVEAEALAANPLPEEPKGVTLRDRHGEVMAVLNTEELALAHDWSLELEEGYITVKVAREEDLS
jgi:serine/threonine protein kinase